MNVAMIMCHKNPNQVIRLINKLSTKNTNVVVHADTFMGNNDFQIISDYINGTAGVYLTDKRIHGELDSRSLVDIVMLMIARSKRIECAEDKHFDYYLLLSGQDYPIKSLSFIESELKELYPKPLIDCTPWSRSNWIYKKFSKNKTLLRYRKWVSTKCKKPKTLSWIFFRGIGYFWRLAIGALHISDYDKLIRQNVSLFGGSAWWILPDVAVDYIDAEYHSNHPYVHKLLETYTPEETFFQIMTMRSPVGMMVKLNTPDCLNQNCKTWAYFNDTDKPFCGHPYILTIDKKDLLSELSDYWIARKFDAHSDNEILDYLDLYLN